MSLHLDKSPQSKALQLFVLLNHLDKEGITIKSLEGKVPFVEVKEGKIFGTIAVARYLNSISKDKSFLVRKEEFDFALVSFSSIYKLDTSMDGILFK